MTTTSGESGEFSFQKVEPGRYRMRAESRGFAPAEFGARVPASHGAVVHLLKGQRIANLKLGLHPQSVIAGRVENEDREPVAGIRVFAFSLLYQAGKRRMISYGGGTTNDLGEYRIVGLPATSCYLVASVRMKPRTVTQADNAETEEYVQSYYPGTPDFGGASQLLLSPGGELTNVTIRLAKTRTVRIRGRVLYDGRPIRPDSILLAPRETALTQDLKNPRVNVAGQFEFIGIQPGRYYIQASLVRGDAMYSTRQPLDVGKTSIDDLDVRIRPLSEIAGKMRVSSKDDFDWTTLGVRLRPFDYSDVEFGSIPQVRVSSNGTFRLSISGVDRYRVHVIGLSDSYYVESVRAGGADVLAGGFNPVSSVEPLEVILRADAGRVEGTVQDSQTKPAGNALIVLIPLESDRRGQEHFYRSATSNDAGAFAIGGLPPGDYKAFAWEDTGAIAYLDPEFVKPFESRGEAFRIRENDHQNVRLTLIAAEGETSGRKK